MKLIIQISTLIFFISTIVNAQSDSYVYIASATASKDEGGIGIFRLNGTTGKLSRVATDLNTETCRYLTIDANAKKLYSIDTDSIYAFQINPESGTLTQLNSHLLYGRGACHVSIHPSGRLAFVANYSGGQVLSFKLDESGQIASLADTILHERTSIDTNRQQEPHPHMALPSPEGKWLLVPDLGADLTYVYAVDKESGQLSAKLPSGFSPAGKGPRHFAFHPTLSMGYVLNEIIGSVTSFNYNVAEGQLQPLTTISTLPDSNTLYSKSADIHITPNGQYLFASNRGPNTIAIFKIDEDGVLESRGWFESGGKTPRAFGIDPTGKYLIAANKESNNLIVFEIDYETGSAKMVDQASVNAPQGVKFLRR